MTKKRLAISIALASILTMPLYFNQSAVQNANAFGGITDQVVAVWQHKDGGRLTSPDYDIYYSFLGDDGAGNLVWHAIGGPVSQVGPVVVLSGDDKNPHVSTGGTAVSTVTIAVWQHQNADGSWDILSSKFTGAGTTGWDTPIAVTTQTGNEFDPNIAVDSNGVATAVWIQDIGGVRDVRFSIFSAGSWSAPGIVGTLGGNPSLPEITITSVPSAAGPLLHKAVATWSDTPPAAGGSHRQVYSIFDGITWTTPVDIDSVIGLSIPDVGFATYSGLEPDPFGAYGRNGITADGAGFAYIVWSGGPIELGFGSPGVVGAILDVSTNTLSPMLTPPSPFDPRFIGTGGCEEPDAAIVGTAEFVNNFAFADFIEDSRRVAGAFTFEQFSYDSPSSDHRPSNAAFSSTVVISANWHSDSPGDSPATFPGEIAWSAGTLNPPLGFASGISWTPAANIVPGGLVGDDRFPELASAFTIEVITGGFTLTPQTAINQVGTTHTVSATVTVGGNPAAGVIVNFSVTGANTASGTAVTDAAGVATFTYTGTNPGTDTITATATADGLALATTATKIWEEAPPPEILGRMTGGGSIMTTAVGKVTHGFGLHCDANESPNNLQVNWGKGNKFHLLIVTHAHCGDIPTISEGKPVAGFDTIHGVGIGRLNGVFGATAHWTITDAGEPGKSDTFAITIQGPTGNPVISVSGTLEVGNHQAHPP